MAEQLHELVETAKIIHEQMVWANEQPGPAQVWQNGNSTAEFRARRAAQNIIESLTRSTGSEASLDRAAKAVAAEIDAIDGALSNTVNEETHDEFRERAARQIAKAALDALATPLKEMGD